MIKYSHKKRRARLIRDVLDGVASSLNAIMWWNPYPNQTRSKLTTRFRKIGKAECMTIIFRVGDHIKDYDLPVCAWVLSSYENRRDTAKHIANQLWSMTHGR